MVGWRRRDPGSLRSAAHEALDPELHFVLFGGSAETHSAMQETVIKVAERLKSRGKRLADASARELRDTFHDVTDQE